MLRAPVPGPFQRWLHGCSRGWQDPSPWSSGGCCKWEGANDTHEGSGSQFAAEGRDCNISNSNSRQGRQFPKLPPGGNLRWREKVSFEGMVSPLKARAGKYQPGKQGWRASLLKHGHFPCFGNAGAEVSPQTKRLYQLRGIMVWLLSLILSFSH